MVTDPISDMLIQIKNAQMVSKERVSLPFSKIKFKIATLLKDGGFVADVSKKKKKMNKSEQDYLEVGLKYNEGKGALHGVKLISKPSRHMYVKADEIKPVRSGFGISVISTSKGVMTGTDARKNKLGGEIICEVW